MVHFSQTQFPISSSNFSRLSAENIGIKIFALPLSQSLFIVIVLPILQQV